MLQERPGGSIQLAAVVGGRSNISSIMTPPPTGGTKALLTRGGRAGSEYQGINKILI